MKCKGLKARHVVDVYDNYSEHPCEESSQVYLKSEADKVIAELKAENERLRGESCKLTDGCLRLKQCRKEKANIADELQKATDSAWSKFSEKTPEHHQSILCYCPSAKFCKVALRRWDEGTKFDVFKQELYTHWMRLPEEPKDDEGTNNSTVEKTKDKT